MHIRKSQSLKLFCSTLVVFVFLGFFNSCQTAGRRPEQFAAKRVQPAEAPRNIDEAVKENPQENLPLLIEYIRENSDSESEMFRYAHDWVAQNLAYDVAGLRGESRKVTDAYGVLQYGKSVCAGYSNALQLLCDELGIECVTISGYGRGASFDPYREEQMTAPRSNHAWNAVKLDGKWHLVDVTWNSGYVRGGKFEPNFNHHYYKVPPRQFAYRHFPLEEKWQLLEEPLDFEGFISQPLLRGRFFTYGFRQQEEYEKITVIEEHEHTLQFRGDTDMLMSARIVAYPDQSTEFQGYEMITRDSEGTHTVHVRFPEPGRYRLMLFAKHRKDRGSFSSLGSYYFEASVDAQGAGREVIPFPQVFGRFKESGISNLQPDEGVLSRGEPQRFSFTTGEQAEYYLFAGSYGHFRFDMNKDTGTYELETSLNGDEVYLSKKVNNRFYHLAKYQLE